MEVEYYTLIYTQNIELYETLEDALEAAKTIVGGWTIIGPNKEIIWDSMDRVGP